MRSISSNLRFLTQNFNKLGLNKLAVRNSSYNSSQIVSDVQNENVKYEVTKEATDWAYVERLLKPQIVPEIVFKEKYPSDFKPQQENLKDHKYFVSRTKNHMMPVYLDVTQRGMRKVTVIRKIQGDIWLLEKELRQFLQKYQSKTLSTQVNEFVGFIRIHGDHVNAVKHFLTKRGY